MQKEGHKGLTGLERGKPCKNFEGKRQKILSGAQPSRRERGNFEKFGKSDFEKVQSDFLKNMIHEFQSIENQPRSIETDRDFNKTI